MTLYWFETRFDKKLSPYPSAKLSQNPKKTDKVQDPNLSQAEVVENIIKTNIDTTTLNKIEQYISIPLKTLITPRTSNRRKTCNNIPRPQNNFVLYRRNLHAIIAREQGSATAKNFKLVSNLAAKKWADESNEIKQLFEIIADCAKKVHDYTYPEYVYQPRIHGKTTMKFRPMNMDESVFEESKGGGGKVREPKSVVPSLLLTTFSLTEPTTEATLEKVMNRSNEKIEAKKESQQQQIREFTNTNQFQQQQLSFTSYLQPVDVPINSNSMLSPYDKHILNLFK
ncbi:hypothetical protein RclHR1_01160021 [Rhizophagus clarus]|uniref:High mobility group box domain-containing protein n=1 Tax=Rhizophagus clarus TaxID=94130 RepID=A0A2Z6Q4U8_9GLOM|nr:hypothetical protein RclHR1_01160021 [Rhizophagus clarus]GET01390.1 high mobility group box domain-containing protein [Rhizophagus clarus]